MQLKLARRLFGQRTQPCGAFRGHITNLRAVRCGNGFDCARAARRHDQPRLAEFKRRPCARQLELRFAQRAVHIRNIGALAVALQQNTDLIRCGRTAFRHGLAAWVQSGTLKAGPRQLEQRRVRAAEHDRRRIGGISSEGRCCFGYIAQVGAPDLDHGAGDARKWARKVLPLQHF